MNLLIKILASVFFLLLVAVGGVFIISGNEENKIKSEIESANYCLENEDCAVLEGKCPFGCYIPVNAREIDRISEMVGQYESNCVYSCIMMEGVECINNKCEVIIDS